MFSIYMGMTCSHVIYSSDWSAEPHIVWSTQVVCRNTQVCTQHRLSHVCLYIDIRTHTQIALNLIGQHIRMMVKCWTVCSAKLVLARLHPAQCHYTYIRTHLVGMLCSLSLLSDLCNTNSTSQANNYNVEICQAASQSEEDIYSDRMSLKLLSKKLVFEDLQHFRAPSVEEYWGSRAIVLVVKCIEGFMDSCLHTEYNYVH